MKLRSAFAIAVLIAACAQIRTPVRVGTPAAPPPPSNVISQSDITYVGNFRVPLQPGFSAGAYGGITGRTVGGNVRLFAYGNNGDYFYGTIASGTSTTVFTLNAGQGAFVIAGQKLSIVRAAINPALPEWRTIQSVAGDQVTVTPALGGTPAAGDQAVRGSDYVYEIQEPGSGYASAANWATGPRATLITEHLDIYQGRRSSWDSSGNITHPAGGTGGLLIPLGLYWHEAEQLLHWTYYQSYNVTGYPDWSHGATDLSGPTAYGPWREKVTDVDGRNWYGSWRCGYLFAHPDGTMLCGGPQRSGNHSMSWGPSTYGGAWPIRTTACCSPNDYVLSNRYLDYYVMNNTQNPNYFNYDGSVVGIIRSFEYRGTSYSYIFEDITYDRTNVNPALNGGVGTFQDESNSITGAIWLQLTNKRGVIFSGNLTLGPSTTPTDCTNASHTWYRNEGQVRLALTSVSGTFAGGENVTGGTSGATGNQTSWQAAPGRLHISQSPPQQAIRYSVGEVVTGGTSGATGTVSQSLDAGECAHLCESPTSVTGPTSTKMIPSFTIFDPNHLTNVKNGITTDYLVDAQSIIDLEAVYGIRTAPVAFQGRGKNITGFYWDSTRNYLFTASLAADTSRAGDTFPETLFHVWHIADTAPPAPAPMTVLAPWMMGVALGLGVVAPCRKVAA